MLNIRILPKKYDVPVAVAVVGFINRMIKHPKLTPALHILFHMFLLLLLLVCFFLGIVGCSLCRFYQFSTLNCVRKTKKCQ